MRSLTSRSRLPASHILPQSSVTSSAHFFHSSPPCKVIHDSILETIGRTPVVRVNNLEAPNKVNLFAKCEFFNPLSSVKDRLAIAVIEDAERTGALKPGQTVVEATSGNTGISVAMVCAQKGYPCVVVMAETFSIERRKIMRALGAKVILTPAAGKGTGMVKKAKELADTHGWYLCSQFENPANPQYHAQTTGAEILLDFTGKQLDYWVTGYGTGGTFQGAGKVIKQACPNTKIILSEPSVANLIDSGKEQKRNADGSPAETHAAFKPHPIQGWTPDFISQITEDGLRLKLHDELVLVSPEEAIATARLLSTKEGIFTGISGGATMKAALDVAARAKEGSNILVMLPDTAERYISTPLFSNIDADMNEEEIYVSKSSPSFQL